MTARHCAFLLALFGLCLAGCTHVRVDASAVTSGPRGLSPNQALPRADTLATFTAASSLSISMTGTIWVADRGAGYLMNIARDGTRSRAGLPGGRPTAVDASGGLRVLVANELEGTIDIHGLSGDLLMRLRLPTSSEDDFTSTPEYLDDQADALDTPSGTAGDVVHLLSGAVVAIESSARFLVFWDESGRAQRTVSEAAGTRIQPAHLARIPSGIAVTEPAENRVLFFDDFGTLSGQQSLPAVPLSIASSGAEVWVATTNHLICLSPSRESTGAARSCKTGSAIEDNPAGPEIVDLAVSPEAFYLLTPRALLRLSRESNGR